ncbi:MAG: THUMP domain-containing protein [Candidatus Woesearchaeota archaeon]
MNCLLVRYGEISLKGNNRAFFERQLAHNIRSCLAFHKHPFTEVFRMRNRIVVTTEKVVPELRNVLGIVSFSPATQTNPDQGSILAAIPLHLFQKKSFRVSTKRLDKNFSLNSIEMDRLAGEYVQRNVSARVDLKSYELELGIEILSRHAFVFTEKIRGFSGLPLGVGGKAVALVDGKGILAAWLMMKRGVMVQPASFEEKDISLLQKYAYGHKMSLRLLESESELNSLGAPLVVGQTLEDFSQLDCFVLRPLIGYSADDIQGLWCRIR